MPDPLEQPPGHDDLAYHKAKVTGTPLMQQIDEVVAFLVRDFPVQFADGFARSFPTAAAAIPPAKWRQIGLAALGLLGVNWLVAQGPEMANSLIWLGGVGLAGFTAWSMVRHTQLVRRDETAKRFAEHTKELGSEGIEQRIAALAALDQLAYDTPRYRRPLVHLLTAWLGGRDALGHQVASGADCSVARQMLVEFQQMLLAEPDTGRERAAGTAFLASVMPATTAAVLKPAAQAATDTAADEITTKDPGAAESATPTETPVAEAASEGHTLEVVEAAELPAAEDTPAEEQALPPQRASAGE